MKFDDTNTVENSRYNKVVKHNDLVQKSRFDLSITAQKTVNFLISLIKPQRDCTDVQPLEYDFEIKQYCKICGIDYDAGKNYKMVRDTLKTLRDKSIMVELPNGKETPVSWINKFWCDKGSGVARVRFDEDMMPYLFQLSSNTTQYALLNVLPMKSKYSVRMYEICRSWAGIRTRTYTLEELRKKLEIPENSLVNFKDFRKYVLEISQREINEYTDLNISYEPYKKGRKVEVIKIIITEKEENEKTKSHNATNDILNGEF